jgi:hypothetical protein
MATPIWADFFKTWDFAFARDPVSRSIDPKDVVGAGIAQPDAIPTLNPDGSFWSNSDSRLIRLRETNDFIDLSTVSNRQSRYKEYERLRTIPEIECALSVFSDEACLAGSTLVATPFGMTPIEKLAQKHPQDKFLVYCYDFSKKDYVLGWAHSPRKTKTAETILVILDSGNKIECTPDHRILMRDGTWRHAGELKEDDHIMPFYRKPVNQNLTNIPSKQYPRIFTFTHGWIHERHFVDSWRSGKVDKKMDRVAFYARMLAQDLNMNQIAQQAGCDWKTVKNRLRGEGHSVDELRWLGRNKDYRRVLGVVKHKVQDVYDLTVDEHHNFATDCAIVHNCQKDSDGNVIQIHCADEDVKMELEFLFLHRNMINLNRRVWSDFKSLLLYGDLFYELVINLDDPKEGVMKLTRLPPESMYRIETTKGRVVEFQQSKEGPDYQSLTKAPVVHATDQEIAMATAIRFSPEQVVHARLGDDRRTFYPYGVSIVEPARGPANQLRLMEDSMLVYRLSRSPERRVFYIDVGTLPPFKAEAFIERLKDQFRKKKVSHGQGTAGGYNPNAVDEKYHAPAVDEDFWLPIRPNSNTKIETLPGAQNLGEIDDAIYFRNRLFTALQFPKNYMNTEDPNQTKVTLSSQDVRVARLIERFQAPYEDILWEIADRHLKLRGFPTETYEDLKIKMTQPSEWRELSRAEVVNARIQNATSIKGSNLMSDYDILTGWMKYPEEQAKIIVARMKMQKIEDAKLQVLSQNPALLGVGIPNDAQPDQQNQLGTTPEGPNNEITPEGGPPSPEQGGGTPPGLPPEGESNADSQISSGQAVPLREPTEDELIKYDLEIQNYASEEDIEPVDFSDL